MPTLAELLGFSVRPFTPYAPGSDWASASPSMGGTTAYPAASNTTGPAYPLAGWPQNSGNAWSAFGTDSMPLGASTSNQSVAPVPANPPKNSSGGILGPIMAQSDSATSQAGGILQNLFGDSAINPLRVIAPPTWPIDTLYPASLGSKVLPIADPTVSGLSPGSFAATPYSQLGGPAVNAWPTAAGVVDQVSWPSQFATPDKLRTVGGFSGMTTPKPADSFLPWLPYRSDGIPLEEAASPGQTSQPQIYARIHVSENDDWLAPAIHRGQVGSFDLGRENDWSAYLRHAQLILPSAITNDPRIDRTTRFLIDALTESAREIGVDLPFGMRATVFGTRVHTDFARRIRELDLPGIGRDGVEQSWSLDDFARYGLAGSRRTDVYLRDPSGRPMAIYDVKTGNARLSPQRIQELRDYVGAGNIPVIELHYSDLTALQR